MDPNATLRDFREAMARARADGEGADPNDTSADYDALQDAVAAAEALDEYLSRGGFLPAAWDGYGRDKAAREAAHGRDGRTYAGRHRADDPR